MRPAASATWRCCMSRQGDRSDIAKFSTPIGGALVGLKSKTAAALWSSAQVLRWSGQGSARWECPLWIRIRYSAQDILMSAVRQMRTFTGPPRARPKKETSGGRYWYLTTSSDNETVPPAEFDNLNVAPAFGVSPATQYHLGIVASAISAVVIWTALSRNSNAMRLPLNVPEASRQTSTVPIIGNAVFVKLIVPEPCGS